MTWEGHKGISYEVDPRHAEIVIEQLDLKNAKSVSTAGTKDEGHTQDDHEMPLDDKEASMYRAIVARCNYLALDRPDIAYSVKELARQMLSPRRGDMQRFKRLGRYLMGRPRLQQLYGWQRSQEAMQTYSDADWAGCKETRKSTTGGCITIGSHAIKGWSRTQGLIALSSGESKLYAALKAAAETFGMLAVCNDLGWRLRGEVWGDASVALGIIHRQGLGKTRHIDIGCLWVQQVAAQQRLQFQKVFGKENPADLFTKYLDEKTNKLHTSKLEYEFKDGRAIEAPQLHKISQSMDDYLIGCNVKEWEGLHKICPEIRDWDRTECVRNKSKQQTSEQRHLRCVMTSHDMKGEGEMNGNTGTPRTWGNGGSTPLRRQCEIGESHQHHHQNGKCEENVENVENVENEDVWKGRGRAQELPGRPASVFAE